MKKMKMYRRVLALLTTLLLFAGSSKAQVFIADDEFEGTMRLKEEEFVLFVPNQGHEADQSFSPVGSGMLLLTCLGGAYLLTKRKKKE